MARACMYVEANSSWISIESEYDKNFVAALKEDLPAAERQWNGPSRMWQVTENFYDEALKAVRKFYNPVEIYEDGALRYVYDSKKFRVVG